MLPPPLLEAMADRIAAHFGLRYPPAEYPALSRKLAQMAADEGEDPADLVGRLVAAPWGDPETALLARALTVKETYFCRERPAFRALRELVVPSLVRDREAAGRTVRCWSAACATGEEAYSAAMLFWSVLPVPESWQVRIAATDVDPAALATAERGRYSAWSFRNVSPRVIDRFFHREPGGALSVVPALRQWVSFSRQNLVTGSAPATGDNEGYDLVICRNVLIYFTPDAIGTVIGRLAGALREGGWLVVGITEAPFVRDPTLVPVRAPGITLFRKQETAASLSPPTPIPAAPRRRSTVRRHAEPARPMSGGHRRRPDRHTALRSRADAPLAVEAPGLAHRHADRGDLSAALEAVDAALAADPLDPRNLYLRAMVLNEQGRLDEAMEAMRRVVYADPASILALYWLGVWALGAGRPREARRALREARALCAALVPGVPVPDGEGLGAERLMTMIDSILADLRENA